MQAKYDLIYKNFVLIPVAIAHWVTIKRTHAQQPVGKPKYVRIGCVLNTIRKYKDILKKPGAWNELLGFIQRTKILSRTDSVLSTTSIVFL